MSEHVKIGHVLGFIRSAKSPADLEKIHRESAARLKLVCDVRAGKAADPVKVLGPPLLEGEGDPDSYPVPPGLEPADADPDPNNQPGGPSGPAEPGSQADEPAD